MTESGADNTGITIALPHGTDAAAIARRFIEEHVDGIPTNLLEDAKLLTSEVVTNAVLHGVPAITLYLRVTPPSLGVAVHDDGQDLPHAPDAPPAALESHGRGLLIVDALAEAWGVEQDDPPPGKTVWFQLRAQEG